LGSQPKVIGCPKLRTSFRCVALRDELPSPYFRRLPVVEDWIEKRRANDKQKYFSIWSVFIKE